MNYENAKILLPMSGSNGGTSFTDYSLSNRTITPVGNAQTSTAQSKFYGSSLLCDGTGDYLSVPSSSDFNISTGLYVAFYVRFSSLAATQPFASRWNNGSDSDTSFLFNRSVSSGNLQFNYRASNGTTFVSTPVWSWSPSTDVWYHVAVSWDGSTFRAFIDGTQLGSGISESTAFNNPAQPIHVAGQLSGGSTTYLNGHMQDFVFVPNSSVHTSNFTPPGKLAGTLSNQGTGGEAVKDDTGSAAARTIIAVPRNYTANGKWRYFRTTSDGSGLFSLTVPSENEFSDISSYAVLALDDAAGTVHNDLVHVPGSTV